jgi:hypothetical protein
MVLRLGTTQTLAWASSYHLPALLAAPLAAELGMAVTHVFGAFTLALVTSALVGLGLLALALLQGLALRMRLGPRV